MTYRKYVGKTYEEAVLKMKVDLAGICADINKVYITHRRNIKKGGFLGFFAATYVEITVGVPDLLDKPSTTTNYGIHTDTRKYDTKLKKDIPTQKDVIDPALQAKFDDINTKLNTIISVQKLSDREVGIETPEDLGKLEEFMQCLMKSDLNQDLSRSLMIKVRRELNDYEMLDKNLILKKLTFHISKMIRLSPTLDSECKPPKLVFLVGPTGVGKTTTLAKLGAKYYFNEGKKIMFVSFDTIRIGAMQQLKAYADIMSVPFKSVTSKEELIETLKKCSADIILIDTSGRNQKDIMRISELKTVIDFTENYNSEIHLVISATTKERDLLNICDNYEKLGYNNIIITKMDETIAVGSILNMLDKVKKPLSYVTFGQNVPNDIEVANPDKFVNLVLNV